MGIGFNIHLSNSVQRLKVPTKAKLNLKSLVLTAIMSQRPIRKGMNMKPKSTKKKKSKKFDKVETFTKEKIVIEDKVYSDEEIKAFQDECGRKSFSLSEFREVLEKEVHELSYKDVRVLISKMGQLSDEEREKYASVLFLENLTEEEVNRYRRIYPTNNMFDRYFKSKGAK